MLPVVPLSSSICVLLAPNLWRGLFSILLGLLLYLSFKPNPAIQDVGWMPKSAAEWFDLYDQWKNFLGFAAMGFTGFMAWPEGVGLASTNLTRRRVRLALLLCGIIIVIELIQIPIPRRWCDPKDILAGSIGVWASWPLVSGFRWLIEGFTRHSSGNRTSMQ
jgi:hypothetical protein